MTGQKERVFPILDVENDVYIAYLPLAHILEFRNLSVLYGY